MVDHHEMRTRDRGARDATVVLFCCSTDCKAFLAITATQYIRLILHGESVLPRWIFKSSILE